MSVKRGWTEARQRYGAGYQCCAGCLVISSPRIRYTLASKDTRLLSDLGLSAIGGIFLKRAVDHKKKTAGSKGSARSAYRCRVPKRSGGKWTHWDLNPGPSACEADVIPLHHEPSGGDDMKPIVLKKWSRRKTTTCTAATNQICLPIVPTASRLVPTVNINVPAVSDKWNRVAYNAVAFRQHPLSLPSFSLSPSLSIIIPLSFSSLSLFLFGFCVFAAVGHQPEMENWWLRLEAWHSA